MFKRGMSGVIATVLTILFSIVGVVIVGGIVLNQINKAKLSVEDQQMCTELFMAIEPVKCVYNNEAATPAGIVIVARQLSDNAASLTSVGIRGETVDGAAVSGTITGADLPAGQSKIGVLFLSATDQLKKVAISPVFRGPSGKDVVCRPLKAEVNCEKSGVQKLSSDPNRALMTVTHSSGIATGASFSLGDPRGLGYQSFGVQTLVQQAADGSLGSGRATVYLGDVSGGAIQTATFVNGGSGWGGAPAVKAYVM